MEFLQISLRASANIAEGYVTGTIYFEENEPGAVFLSVRRERSEWTDYPLQPDDRVEFWNAGQGCYWPIEWKDITLENGFAGIEARVKFSDDRKPV